MATFGGTTEDSIEGQEPPRAADYQSSAFMEETLREEEARCCSGCGKAGGRRQQGQAAEVLGPLHPGGWDANAQTTRVAELLACDPARRLHPGHTLCPSILYPFTPPSFARWTVHTCSLVSTGKSQAGGQGSAGWTTGWTSLTGLFLLGPAWWLHEGGSARGCYRAPTAPRIMSY